MTDEHPKYPHPDGLRSGRWSVQREVIGSAEHFGANLAKVIVWVARPIPRIPAYAYHLRSLQMSFPSHRLALAYATQQARHEQRIAYQHHIRQEHHT
jgi:hypothetical protein